MTFEELPLKESSLEALKKLGFDSPTEIQEKSIPILVDGDIDFIGQAQTGTGKTAAFVLPLLEKIDFNSKNIEALILAPTRELANQICEEVKKLSSVEPIRCLSVYGGVPLGNQIRDIKRVKPQIVVGTPGRLVDLIERNAIDFSSGKFAVLDEADEMLDMGFFDDVKFILKSLGDQRRIWMFSATMPGPILRLISDFFSDPQIVKVQKKTLSAENVEQFSYIVRTRDRSEALCRLLDCAPEKYAIVFCRTKIESKELSDELNLRGFPSDALHGDLSQDQRDLTMKKFKDKKIDLLVCTDVAARGIDVDNLTHVINYGLPQDNEAYVHRIGRTGRAGNKGLAVSIITPPEVSRLRVIERMTKAKVEVRELPTVDQIKEIILNKSLNDLTQRMESIEEEHRDDRHYKTFCEKFEEVGPELLLKSVYSFIYDSGLKRYSKARPIDVKASAASSRGASGGRSRGGDNGMEKIFVSAGRKDGLEVGQLIRLVSRGLHMAGSEIGKIVLMDEFSFLDIPARFAPELVGLKGIKVGEKEVNFQISKSERRSSGRGGYGGSRGRGGQRSNSRRGNARENSRSY
jgi:ATP-dependent RNA helicase DeaD